MRNPPEKENLEQPQHPSSQVRAKALGIREGLFWVPEVLVGGRRKILYKSAYLEYSKPASPSTSTAWPGEPL